MDWSKGLRGRVRVDDRDRDEDKGRNKDMDGFYGRGLG